jgi:hypothetical protein
MSSASVLLDNPDEHRSQRRRFQKTKMYIENPPAGRRGVGGRHPERRGHILISLIESFLTPLWSVKRCHV